MVKVLYFAVVFLVQQRAVVAGVVGDGKHIGTGTRAECRIFKELQGETGHFLVDEGRCFEIEVVVGFLLVKGMTERCTVLYVREGVVAFERQGGCPYHA
ncbi:hypothetical protein Barb7_02930 [Bacteroidales bacterium Barb7]|nr:hypothetical protein Barb7_02930 [Bacteroidales bacterium Barb7]